jgi:hypothetical protein
MDLTMPLESLDTSPSCAMAAPRELPLAAGRTVLVVHRNGNEEVQLRSRDGALEVRIVLTEQGPVVRLQAGRLEIETPEEIDLKCRKFSLQTQEGTHLSSDGEIRVNAAKPIVMRSRQEMDLKGRPFRVNVYDGIFDNEYFYPEENGPAWGTAFAGMDVSIDPRYEAILNDVAGEPWFSELPQLLDEVEQQRRKLDRLLR